MKRNNLTVQWLALLVLLNPQVTTLAAQATSFTYQGHLSDNGSPASGIYDLRFTIYNSSSGPAAVGGPLTNSAITVSNGLFTVSLDFGVGVFDGTALWLEIGATTNGIGNFTTLSPRQAITPTPYAITAANLTGAVAASQLSGTIAASNISPGSITGVMLANGAVGSNQLAAGSVTTANIAAGAVTSSHVATVSNSFALTLLKYTPLSNDRFGSCMAKVGNDRVLIGAFTDNSVTNGGGAAYLFSTNGALLTAFYNPTPAMNESFGCSVAAVGNDRVLIGARQDAMGAFNAGAAYLFSTNGTLLTTFTNPTPVNNDYFGHSVAAVGSDRVLIGANQNRATAPNYGVAYLFNTSGLLLATFINPTPAPLDNFGESVAAVGSDLILIGAYWDDTGAPDTGAVYMFNTNGTLLTTFANPTPVNFENFGKSLLAIGPDRFLVGTPNAHNGATFVGAVYLFNTNGTLLTTFTNPTPTYDDLFGWSLATAGNDKVLIGAHNDDTGATDAGAAYLFNTNGALLTTYTNPTPASSDSFGWSVAMVGNEQVVVGAYLDDSAALNAGAAYLLFAAETFNPLDPSNGIWSRAGVNVFRPIGNVGIGTDNPGFKLEVNGTAGKPGGGSWSVASDERLKKNIRPLTGTLDKLLTLHGVNFEYIAPEKIHELSGERMGLLAQQVEKVFPDWVETGPDGYKRVTVRGLEALLIEGLRELQQAQDAKLAVELNHRDTEITKLKQELVELRALIQSQTSKQNRGSKIKPR